MARLITIEAFEAELDALYETHPQDAAMIDALIEELMDDDELVGTLCHETPKWHYRYKPPFEVKRFEECWNRGKRVYLLKVYDEDGHLIPHRVFVGHDIQTDDYIALSVQPRSTSYDTNDTGFEELCKRYDRERIRTF